MCASAESVYSSVAFSSKRPFKHPQECMWNGGPAFLSSTSRRIVGSTASLYATLFSSYFARNPMPRTASSRSVALKVTAFHRALSFHSSVISGVIARYFGSVGGVSRPSRVGHSRYIRAPSRSLLSTS